MPKGMHPMISEDDLVRNVDDAGGAGDGVIAVAVVLGDGSVVRHARGILTDGRPSQSPPDGAVLSGWVRYVASVSVRL
jgi:hypothetical protein